MSCQPLGEENVKVNAVGVPRPPAGGPPEAGETDTLDAAPVIQKLQVLDAGPVSDPLFPTTYQ
jgi:hypothetical protein